MAGNSVGAYHSVRQVIYNYEYESRIRACFIGAGPHAFRNILPALRYAPVDLVAICDRSSNDAAAFSRLFGAKRHYDNYRTMIARERPEAVFIVTGYGSDGSVEATELAAEMLQSGANVWTEKPTAASLDDVIRLKDISERTGRWVMTGIKKVFFPTNEKLKDIIESEAFGRLTSLSVRYPQSLPPEEDRGSQAAMRGFLDHIYHPAALLNYLAGPIERACYERDPVNGATVTTLRFASGAVGSLHLAAGSSGSSPLERTEAVGEKANAVVENGVHLRYYRRAQLPTYGRAASFVQEDEAAALLFEPECSLGQLYNTNMFYLGYVPEILHFCDCAIASKPPQKGTLDDVVEIMKLFEFYRDTPAGVVAHF